MFKKIKEYIKYLKGPILVPVPEELVHLHSNKGPFFVITPDQYPFPKIFNQMITSEEQITIQRECQLNKILNHDEENKRW